MRENKDLKINEFTLSAVILKAVHSLSQEPV